MTKVGLTAALIAITSLTGCAKTVLAKPGVDQAQFQRDKYECMQNAPVSYTHLRAHETKANLVCRLLLEKKK